MLSDEAQAAGDAVRSHLMQTGAALTVEANVQRINGKPYPKVAGRTVVPVVDPRGNIRSFCITQQISWAQLTWAPVQIREGRNVRTVGFRLTASEDAQGDPDAPPESPDHWGWTLARDAFLAENMHEELAAFERWWSWVNDDSVRAAWRSEAIAGGPSTVQTRDFPESKLPQSILARRRAKPSTTTNPAL
jgi:hypothetical protein